MINGPRTLLLQMIIDTIFICFCEDCEKNDGVGRPYFMSRGLMVGVRLKTRVFLSYPNSVQIPGELPRVKMTTPFLSIQEFVENSKKALRNLDQRQAAAAT